MNWRVTRIGRGEVAHLVTTKNNINGRVNTLCGYMQYSPTGTVTGDSICLNCSQTLEDLNTAVREHTDVAVV